MKTPTLTLVLSNYNDGKFIDTALDGFANQVNDIDQFIFIDDASDDGSFEKMQAFALQMPNVILTRNEIRQGVIANFNRLLEQVHTDLVYFASSNDLILPGFFERARCILGEFPQAGLSSGLVRYMSIDGQAQETMASPTPLDCAGYLPPEVARKLLFDQGEWIVGGSTVYRTSALREAGGFMPQLFGACDGFAAALIAARHGACFVPEVQAQWRRDPSGFAGTTLMDFARAKAVLLTGGDQIGRNADIFLPGYGRRWQSRWLFSTLSVAADKGPELLSAAQEALEFHAIPRFMGKSRFLAKIGLFLRLRAFDLPHVVRRRLFSKMRRILNAEENT